MSRIGIKPIEVPENVNILKDSDNLITITGPKGELKMKFNPDIIIGQEESVVKVSRKTDDKTQKSLHGTTRAIISNMISGVTNGFYKELELRGVGFTAQIQGQRLKLTLGFSHDVYFFPPNGIEIKTTKSMITISGIDKQLVGQVAAKIRSIRPPEPFKGKGIRYLGEYVRIKKGKTVGE
tara:strand:- start:20793 stop:21332 length:540 start_codon:yes stop_codon:yes gene_type:complete